MASGKPINAEQRGAILRLALAGNSKSEVAKRLGLSYHTVRNHWPIQPVKTNDSAGRSSGPAGKVSEFYEPEKQ